METCREVAHASAHGPQRASEGKGEGGKKINKLTLQGTAVSQKVPALEEREREKNTTCALNRQAIYRTKENVYNCLKLLARERA